MNSTIVKVIVSIIKEVEREISYLIIIILDEHVGQDTIFTPVIHVDVQHNQRMLPILGVVEVIFCVHFLASRLHPLLAGWVNGYCA